jgi:hypothetical protein
VTPDEKTLHALICYAGSAAGDAMRRAFLSELEALRDERTEAAETLGEAIEEALSPGAGDEEDFWITRRTLNRLILVRNKIAKRTE